MIYRNKWKDVNRLINILVCLIAGVGLMIFGSDIKKSNTTDGHNTKSEASSKVHAEDSTILNEKLILIQAPMNTKKIATKDEDTNRSKD